MKMTDWRFVGMGCAVVLAGCSATSKPADAVQASQAPDRVSPAPANAEEDIRHFLLQEFPDATPMQYALAWHDLDGDGSDEAIVFVAGPALCGTGGCNTLVLTQAGPMWRKVGDISVSRTPVTVLDSATNGWKDLTVAIAGGGGKSGNALLRYDGNAYPSNPTVPPAEATERTGTELVVAEPVFTELDAAARSGGD